MIYWTWIIFRKPLKIYRSKASRTSSGRKMRRMLRDAANHLGTGFRRMRPARRRHRYRKFILAKNKMFQWTINFFLPADNFGNYAFSQEEELKLRDRLMVMRSCYPHKSVQCVLVTTFGLRGKNGGGVINHVITLQDLR